MSEQFNPAAFEGRRVRLYPNEYKRAVPTKFGKKPAYDADVVVFAETDMQDDLDFSGQLIFSKYLVEDLGKAEDKGRDYIEGVITRLDLGEGRSAIVLR